MSYSKIEKLGSHSHKLIYLIVQLQYMCAVLSELLAHNFIENNSIN